MLALCKRITACEWSVCVAWRTHVLIVTLLVAVGTQLSLSQGTTPHIKDIFLGRCWDYQHVLHRDSFQSDPKNCSVLWEHFTEAFAFRDPCDVPMERYEKFAKYAKHTVPKDKVLFWSGVYPFVKRYSHLGHRYYTIGDTLLGYLVNDLSWCGTEGHPGIDYYQCPSWNACSTGAELSYWRMTSIHFASLAKGSAYLMLNATKGPAFKETSTFAEYELPYLNESEVRVLHLLLVGPLEEDERETCETGSIAKLRSFVEEKGIIFKCTENPSDIIHLMCSDDTSTPICEEISRAINSASYSTSHVVVYIGLVISCLLVYISSSLL